MSKSIQKQLDDPSTKETLFNFLMQHCIDDFTYRGKAFNTMDLIADRDSWLDMEGNEINGEFMIHNEFIKEID